MKPLHASLSLVVAIGTALGVAGLAAAADEGEPSPRQQGEGRRRPPAVAFEACSGKGVGDACAVHFRGQTIDGVCASFGDDGVACRPNTPPGHLLRQPPQEAFQACSGKQEGDACAVDFREHHVEGACTAFGDQGLVCRPNRPPPEAPQQ